MHAYKMLAYKMHAHETHIRDPLAYVDPEGIEARRKRSSRIIYSPMKALEALRPAGDTSELLILQEVESLAGSEASINGEASNAGEDGNGEDGIGEVVFHWYRMLNLVPRKCHMSRKCSVV
jgi:hypothetical protein